MNRAAATVTLLYMALTGALHLGLKGADAARTPGDDVTPPFTTITSHAPGEADSLVGAGGTFPAPLYKRWFDAYSSKIGVGIVYDAVGSFEGVNRIINRRVDFAGSDAPMTSDQLSAAKGGQIVHIPTAFGALVLIYNIPGLRNQLRFTSQDIADIFLGEIRRWDDPRLVADNPELGAARQDIIVVHRADGSGSTYGFTDYLSAISPVWQKRSGNGTSVSWPVGIGGRGGDGMTAEVATNPYSVGYVELGTAMKSHLRYGLVKNISGRFTAPSLATIGAAVAASRQGSQSDMRMSVVNAPGPDSYPICTGTWLLAYRNMADRSRAIALTRLLWWAIHDGQAVNESLNYAVVPPELRTQSERLIREINVNGQPAFPGH